MVSEILDITVSISIAITVVASNYLFGYRLFKDDYMRYVWWSPILSLFIVFFTEILCEKIGGVW